MFRNLNKCDWYEGTFQFSISLVSLAFQFSLADQVKELGSMWPLLDTMAQPWSEKSFLCRLRYALVNGQLWGLIN